MGQRPDEGHSPTLISLMRRGKASPHIRWQSRRTKPCLTCGGADQKAEAHGLDQPLPYARLSMKVP